MLSLFWRSFFLFLPSLRQYWSGFFILSFLCIFRWRFPLSRCINIASVVSLFLRDFSCFYWSWRRLQRKIICLTIIEIWSRSSGNLTREKRTWGTMREYLYAVRGRSRSQTNSIVSGICYARDILQSRWRIFVTVIRIIIIIISIWENIK